MKITASMISDWVNSRIARKDGVVFAVKRHYMQHRGRTVPYYVVGDAHVCTDLRDLSKFIRDFKVPA